MNLIQNDRPNLQYESRSETEWESVSKFATEWKSESKFVPEKESETELEIVSEY